MQEVDQHIFEAAKQLDCSFVEENSTLASLTPNDIMEFLIRSLWIIDPSTKTDVPSCKLPPTINARFSTAHKVAEKLNTLRVCPGLNFTEQSLLYGEVSEYRRFFLDVIRLYPALKDPSDGDDHEEGLLSKAARFNQKHEKWTPHYCRQLLMEHRGIFWYPSNNAAEVFPIDKKSDDGRGFITALLNRSEQFSSIPTKPMLAPKPKIAPKPGKFTVSEEDPKAKELAMLEAELNEAQLRYQDSREALSLLNAELGKMQADENQSPISEKLLATLEDADVREKLGDFLAASDGKADKMQHQWDEAYAQKMTELTEARQMYGFGSRLEKLRRRREDYKEDESNCDEQREQAERLLTKLEQKIAKIMGEPADNRDKITKRLFEMMASLRKQQEELDKVLAENATIQKEMNWTSQTLYRSFAIIEDALYKIHENYKGGQMYRTFGRINLTCSSSTAMIEKNGNIQRQSEKLVDQLEVEKQKSFSARLERMQRDLELVRQENAELNRQLRH